VVVDGSRLCVVGYDALIPGSTRHALLLHGNPSHLDHFGAIVPALRRWMAVTAYDHPGFGRSSEFADRRMSLERSARVALAVLESQGVTTPVDLIGHSHGGLVALAIAALAPARVRSVVLIGTGAAPAPTGYRILRAVPGLASGLPALAAAMHRGAALAPVARWVTRAIARGSMTPDAAPGGFLEGEVEAFGTRPEVLGAMVRLALDDPGAKATRYARDVRAPVLLIHGRRDALVGLVHARRLHAIVARRGPGTGSGPAARLVEVDGGHMVHLAHPERVIPVFDDWYASEDPVSYGSRT